MVWTPRPGGPARALLDVALVLWTVAWLWMGVTVAREVRGLSELSGTVSRLGNAVGAVGGVVGGLPLVGDRVSGAADAIGRAGREAVVSAGEARDSARRVGVLLGISIALIPTSPVLLIYLPRRMALRRERVALRAALAGGRTRALDELLAERAVTHLPYHRLHRVSADPHGDLESGRLAALADAELAWYGVPPPRAPARRVPR